MDEHPPSRKMTPEPPSVKISLMRTLVRLLVVVVVVIALHALITRTEAWISTSQYSWAMPGLTLAVLLIYALMIAIPFVPGVEIGLSVLALSGPSVAPMVWIATTLGLSLAYVAGCKVPYRWLHRVFLDLHLTGACRLLQRFEGLPPKGRVAFLQSQLPTRFGPYVLRFRYLGLAVLINIPGNSVIGGGGGITLLAGVSGLFRMPATVLTIALATAPVPMAIWLFGWEIPWR
ncbi:hypothetical protein ROG8370_00902 [Roseovarius gaetbuli]|uniref:SNARE associated Golgi protein n=1 Tax=Roseovarius gaetbuli TaxID=1356575 RepID=A0A1X6YLD2_9RHOB|nr:hypothetical protein [Roseovarius gaetbuli]SLN24781.1 hypothetical protein ROG8370_00902 [Roseovarius gaetbuli]